MIILVENKEDKIALNEIYLTIEELIDEYTEHKLDLRRLKPIYNARVINIEKEPQA